MLSRRLEVFLSVVEHGSFSKAAVALYVSTVSVKRQIDSLETDLGVKLFDRSTQGVTLTNSGREFYNEAKKFPYLEQRAKARARNAAAPERLLVRFGTSMVWPCKPVTDFCAIEGLVGKRFDLRIVPFGDDNASMNNVVASLGKDIDCFASFCDSIHWRNTCNILLLDHKHLRISMSKNHRLAQKSLLTWDDLEGESIIIPQSSDFTVLPALQREIIEHHPSIHIVKCPPFIDVDTFNRCSQGDCLMASFSLWKDVHPLLTTVPVDWDYTLPYGIVYSATPSQAMSQFADAVQKALDEERSQGRRFFDLVGPAES